MKFYPYEKKGEGGGQSLSHAEGGRGRNSFSVLFLRKLEGLTIL